MRVSGRVLLLYTLPLHWVLLAVQFNHLLIPIFPFLISYLLFCQKLSHNLVRNIIYWHKVLEIFFGINTEFALFQSLSKYTLWSKDPIILRIPSAAVLSYWTRYRLWDSWFTSVVQIWNISIKGRKLTEKFQKVFPSKIYSTSVTVLLSKFIRQTKVNLNYYSRIYISCLHYYYYYYYYIQDGRNNPSKFCVHNAAMHSISILASNGKAATW